MLRIGLLSDTHGYMDEVILDHLRSCDEIWHAGDFGPAVAEQLKTIKPLRGVYGNIDAAIDRYEFPENNIFMAEGVKVFIRHIGGYPGHYAPGVKNMLADERPKLFISGHSHILRVIYDDKLQCLHMNPGAVGKHGWHKVRTLLRFTIDGANIKDCEVVELGKRGSL